MPVVNIKGVKKPAAAGMKPASVLPGNALTTLKKPAAAVSKPCKKPAAEMIPGPSTGATSNDGDRSHHALAARVQVHFRRRILQDLLQLGCGHYPLDAYALPKVELSSVTPGAPCRISAKYASGRSRMDLAQPLADPDVL